MRSSCNSLLAFTHEGALVLLFAIVATLVPRGLRSVEFIRATTGFAIILMLAALSKIVLPPDDYYAGVLVRAAMHFFDPEIFRVEAVLALLAALTGFGAIFAAMSLFYPKRACLCALGLYADRIVHLLAAVRSICPRKQPLLSAHGAGPAYSGVRRAGRPDGDGRRGNLSSAL